MASLESSILHIIQRNMMLTTLVLVDHFASTFRVGTLIFKPVKLRQSFHQESNKYEKSTWRSINTNSTGASHGSPPPPIFSWIIGFLFGSPQNQDF